MPISDKQNYVQFLNQANLERQQKLVRGYYQQLIRMYGVTVDYFRRSYDFYDPDGLLNIDGNFDWTYGYDSQYEYGNETEMIGYIEMGNDAFIFSMVGADSEQDGKIFFSKEQFELDMLDAVGVITTGSISASGTIDFTDYYGLYDVTTDVGPFQVTVSGDVTIDETDHPADWNGTRTLTVTEINTTVNSDIAGDKSYVKNWVVQGSILGSITGLDGTIDENGDGTLQLDISGNLVYNVPPTDAQTNGWGIAPQVGDFIRITFGDGTTEDYEFTEVSDRDLNNDGISPFLGKFVWKCQFTRRSASHETVPSGSIANEVFENDYLNQQIVIQDDLSDKIYDYDTETESDSDVYGGF